MSDVKASTPIKLELRPTKVELTLGELFNLKDPLSKLLQCKLSVKTAYRLSRLAKKVQDELTIAADSVNTLLSAYQETGPDGGKFIPGPKLEEANDKMADLMAEVVVIELIPISIDDLGDNEVSANDLLLCEKIIVGVE